MLFITSIEKMKPDRMTKTVVYVSFEGDGIAWPGTARERHAAETKANKKVAERVLATLGLQGVPQYSRKAGCSCGCSPGFIVTGNSSGWDIFVTVKLEGRKPRKMPLAESLEAFA
jgi:hypothetical protein